MKNCRQNTTGNNKLFSLQILLELISFRKTHIKCQKKNIYFHYFLACDKEAHKCIYNSFLNWFNKLLVLHDNTCKIMYILKLNNIFILMLIFIVKGASVARIVYFRLLPLAAVGSNPTREFFHVRKLSS